MKWAAGGILALCVGVGVLIGALYWRSPVGALDFLDSWWRSGRHVKLVADGVPFAPGTANKLNIWAPAETPAGPSRPVLVFFYGGSWISGSRGEYGFVGRAFAERGFIVVIPDYRKVPAVRFPTFLQDGAAAIRWTQDNVGRYGGDPRRIIIAGHSAGAYIAVMLALDRRYLRHAGVDANTIRAVAGLAGPYDFYPFRWLPAQVAMGNAADPATTQPIHYARAGAPPLFLATGTKDETIGPRNSISLASRLRKAGDCAPRLVLYPGLSHSGIVMGLSLPFRRIAPIFTDMDRFFRHVLAAHGEPCIRQAGHEAG